MIVAVVVVASSLIGGLITPLFLIFPSIPRWQWPLVSAVFSFRYFIDRIFWSGNRERAFFNDLARELIAIMLIPGLIAAAALPHWAYAVRRRWISPCRSSTYWRAGYGPGGNCSRFFLSLLVPILIAFFSA